MGLYKVSPVYVTLALAVFAFLPSGCSRPVPTQQQPAAEANIQKLASICREFSISQKRPPSNIEELKAWAKKLTKTQRAELGIEDVEQAFKSPRDNQPYVLVRGGTDMMGRNQALAYEKTGVDGKRYVVTPMGSAFEVDEANFKEMVPNAR